MINKFSKTMSFIVVIGAILVMIGWIFDIDILKSILPQFVTIKFLTASCFLLSGILLFMILKNSENRNDWNELMLLFIGFLIILITAVLMISLSLGITTGLENLFIAEAPGTVETPSPGRPAVVTTINFVLVGISGLIIFSRIQRLLIAIRFFGFILIFSGSLVILGYIINIPELYFKIGNISSAMAVYTAILFILLGTGFLSFNTNNAPKDYI